MQGSKTIIVKNEIKESDKFACYGHYAQSNPRCDDYHCPFSFDGTCPSHTRIKRMEQAFEELKINDCSISE